MLKLNISIHRLMSCMNTNGVNEYNNNKIQADDEESRENDKKYVLWGDS